MKALKLYPVLIFLLVCVPGFLFSQEYRLKIFRVDKDTTINTKDPGLQTVFNNKTDCIQYVYKIPSILSSKGYPTASVDSMSFDSASARIDLYLGKKYSWGYINTDSVDKKVLMDAGWNENQFHGKLIDLNQLQVYEQIMLNNFERTGYPFATIRLDSVRIINTNSNEDAISGNLKVSKGPLYHIDSIRVYGKVRVKNILLQRYLQINKGSVYNKDRLDKISQRLAELPYLEEQQHWDLAMLGTGATLDLYLMPKRSSQVNFLIGFLPSNSQSSKAQLTGDVHLDLKNALGAGESILLNWQQLQRKSPRLNLAYQHPYIFNSSFGIDAAFDLLKKDSSYLQINGQAGIQYLLSGNQSGKVFVQFQKTYLLSGGYDTNQVKLTKILPQNIDVSSNSIGLQYEWYNTNYRFNPRKGNELRVTTTAGLKKISRNSDIVNLKDPGGFNFASLYDSLKLKTYQFRLSLSAAHFFPTGKRSTLKTAVNGGIFESQNIFRNELFQIGGYRLLRGFDEESIYASQYAVFTAEYRYLVGLNSFLFGFVDQGFTKTHYQSINFTNSFLGVGIGMEFETKFGLLNLSYAIGKRNDLKFDLRESSKIHFGYINYF